MSVYRPTIKRPNIPELTRPSISKRKRLASSNPSLSKKISAKTTIKSSKKSTRKPPIGTCYLQKNCREVISKGLTRQQCKKQGGKSWKKLGGVCEEI